MSAQRAGSPLDALVIGGGQAGLAMGYHLAELGKSFQIVDAAAEVGQAWRSRWDSLLLFTPAQCDNLPGLPFPAPRDTYPRKDAVVDYLQSYAAEFELPVRLNTAVTSLTREDGVYVAKAGAETLDAKQVVVATGPFQEALVPSIAEGLDSDVHQIHSVDYRNPESVPGGRVLVAGAANSGWLRVPVLWGVVFGIIQAASPLAFWWLNPATVHALGLVLIAAVYIGLAVADGRRSVILVESLVATAFVVLAAIGVIGPAWLLVVGLAGHGVKDLWQQRRQFVSGTWWWPPFCVAVDWVAASAIAIEIVRGVQFH